MRLNSVASAVAVRPSEPQSVSAAASPVVTGVGQPVRPEKCGTMQGITDGGCFPGPSLPDPIIPGIPIPFPGFPTRPPADAGTRKTQGDQLNKIGEGVATGSLTKKETEALLNEQKAIATYQREAMKDGKLDFVERFTLSAMQNRAERNIDGAKSNLSRDFFATSDGSAQVQAGQIFQLAEGRTNGNITHSEAGKLLGQQADIASTRGPSSPLGNPPNLLTLIKQHEAQKDIQLHSKPGTQFDFGDFKPRPKPFPLF